MKKIQPFKLWKLLFLLELSPSANKAKRKELSYYTAGWFERNFNAKKFTKQNSSHPVLWYVKPIDNLTFVLPDFGEIPAYDFVKMAMWWKWKNPIFIAAYLNQINELVHTMGEGLHIHDFYSLEQKRLGEFLRKSDFDFDAFFTEQQQEDDLQDSQFSNTAEPELVTDEVQNFQP